MLSLSTKARYATRALIDLALYDSGEPIPLHKISERQDISIKYLETIMASLKSAGLVSSTKGPQGGYSLNKCPEEITLLDVVIAFEVAVCLVNCVNAPDECSRQKHCAMYDIWKELSTAINTKFSSISIRDAAQLQREKGLFTGEPMFHI